MSAGAAAAKIGLATFAAGLAAKAKTENDIRNMKLAMEARRVASNRENVAFMQNMTALKEQNTSDNFNISVAALQARDQLAAATAGSGIAGQSVDDLSNQITREVGQDRVNAKRMFDAAKDAERQQLKMSEENRVLEARNQQAIDYTPDITASFYSALGDEADNLVM